MAMGREQFSQCMFRPSCTGSYLFRQYIKLPPSVPFGDSAINSPDSFHGSESFPGSSYADSSFDASPQEPQPEFEFLSEMKVSGRPRAPVTDGRDPNENRIQVSFLPEAITSRRLYETETTHTKSKFSARVQAEKG